jgi:hypothetical protein
MGVKVLEKDKNLNPGPGNYDNTKKFHVHTYKFGTDERLKNKLLTTPGPLDYDPKKINLKKDPAFSIGLKPNFKDKNFNPGPGNYSPKIRYASPNYM